MRKIKLFIATSLDGYIARPDGEIDWLFTDQDYGYSDFIQSVDTTLMGYKTFETILKFGGEFPYKHLKNYVLTRKKNPINYPHVEYISHNIVEFIQTLKNKEGKDIWLVGGGEVNTFLLDHRQIDEVFLFIHPVILGEGLPLFSGKPSEKWFVLRGQRAFNTGLIELHLEKK